MEVEADFALFAPSKSAKKTQKGSTADQENSKSNISTVKEVLDDDRLKKMSFGDLGLDKWQVDVLSGLSIFSPTDVQAACVPSILSGVDVSGAAKTGSGKTAAFALPILKRLSEDPFGIYALVLTPTR